MNDLSSSSLPLKKVEISIRIEAKKEEKKVHKKMIYFGFSGQLLVNAHARLEPDHGLVVGIGQRVVGLFVQILFARVRLQVRVGQLEAEFERARENELVEFELVEVGLEDVVDDELDFGGRKETQAVGRSMHRIN